jgi:hypothetical protein
MEAQVENNTFRFSTLTLGKSYITFTRYFGRILVSKHDGEWWASFLDFQGLTEYNSIVEMDLPLDAKGRTRRAAVKALLERVAELACAFGVFCEAVKALPYSFEVERAPSPAEGGHMTITRGVTGLYIAEVAPLGRWGGLGERDEHGTYWGVFRSSKTRQGAEVALWTTMEALGRSLAAFFDDVRKLDAEPTKRPQRVAEAKARAEMAKHRLMMQIANTMHQVGEAMRLAESANGAQARQSYTDIRETLDKLTDALSVAEFEVAGQ